MAEKDYKNQIEMKISHFLFYVFLLLMFFAKGIGLYDGQALYRLLFWSAMLCVAGKIFLTGYTKKQWIWVIILGMLAVLIERHSGEKGVLICYAVVVGMKEIPLKRIMQIGATIYGITMCGMVTYFGVFLEKSTFKPGTRIGVGETIRYALGYPHPNSLQVTYLATITLIIYCLGKKYNWKYAIGLMLGNLYLYSYCMSYTGVITCSLVILLPLYLMYVRKNRFNMVEYCMAGAALPICLTYSFLMPHLLTEEVAAFFSNHVYTLYHRLILSKEHVVLENLSLLGTRVSEVTTSEFSLDNSFLYAFVFNGILFFVIIISAYIYMMYRLIKGKRNLELVIMCVFLLEGIIEPHLFNTSFKNITLFFLGEIIWNNSKYTQGKFDDKMIQIPDAIKEKVLLHFKCWEKNRRAIVTTCIGVGSLISVAFIIINIITKSEGLVIMEAVRSSIAIASAGMIAVGIIKYLRFYLKEK